MNAEFINEQLRTRNINLEVSDAPAKKEFLRPSRECVYIKGYTIEALKLATFINTIQRDDTEAEDDIQTFVNENKCVSG